MVNLFEYLPDEKTRLLEEIKHILGEKHVHYLVGGAVRDVILRKDIHDLDISSSEEIFGLARKVANEIGGAYYPMDEEHGTARVVITNHNRAVFYIDFNRLRGEDIYEDLKDRDFTINAMAVDLKGGGGLIDPLSGCKDLFNKRLVLCSPSAIKNDPVRAIRGIRVAVAFDLRIIPDTFQAIQEGVKYIDRVSIERIRDELFKLLDGDKPASAIQLLERISCLKEIFPELEMLNGIAQSPPHVDDVWNHTINTLNKLELVLKVLASEYDPENTTNFFTGYLSLILGRYRRQIIDHFNRPVNRDRSRKSILMFAALYHDAGKMSTKTVDQDGRIRFFDHDQRGVEIASQRARKLHLSNDEIDAVKTIIGTHMRPILLASQVDNPSVQAIYRFFRKTGSLGIDVCIFSIADTLSTYGSTLSHESWIKFINTIRLLLEAFLERNQQSINPPKLLDGNDLIDLFKIQPGPEIGRILELIKIAQVEGKVNNRQEALLHVKELLLEKD